LMLRTILLLPRLYSSCETVAAVLHCLPLTEHTIGNQPK